MSALPWKVSFGNDEHWRDVLDAHRVKVCSAKPERAQLIARSVNYAGKLADALALVIDVRSPFYAGAVSAREADQAAAILLDEFRTG